MSSNMNTRWKYSEICLLLLRLVKSLEAIEVGTTEGCDISFSDHRIQVLTPPMTGKKGTSH